MLFILTQKLRLYKLHLLLAAAILLCGVYWYARLLPRPSAALPAVPPALPEQKVKEAAPAVLPKELPRRDPFRPLNHPVEEKIPAASEMSVPSKTAAPVPPASPAPPAEKTPAQILYRFSGIVTVNGKRKALVLTPGGSLLVGEGDILPGRGMVEAMKEENLLCGGRQIQLGESWS